jgi:anti-anti-sigma regulatory factor
MGAPHGFAKAHRRGDYRIAFAGDGGAPIHSAAGGVLDLRRCRQLEDAFNDTLDRQPAAILVDLRAVTVIDPGGLYTLLRMVDQSHCVEVEFAISGPVERLLDRAGVKHHLPGVAAVSAFDG